MQNAFLLIISPYFIIVISSLYFKIKLLSIDNQFFWCGIPFAKILGPPMGGETRLSQYLESHKSGLIRGKAGLSG
jgi:hypothetical protein